MATIVSVQTGEVTMAVGNSSVTTPAFTAVTMAQTILFWTHRMDTGNNRANRGFIKGFLASTTTATFNNFGTTVNGAVTIRYYIVQYDSDVSVQRGEKVVGSGVASDTQAITSITQTKSFVTCAFTSTGASMSGDLYGSVRFSADNQLTFQKGASGVEVTFRYQVVQFGSGLTVQSGTRSFTSSDTAPTPQTITAVNRDKTIIIASHENDSGTRLDPNVIMWRGRLTATTTIAWNRNSAQGGGNIRYYVCEWTDSTSVQYGDAAFTTAQTKATGSAITVTSTSGFAILGTNFPSGGMSSYSGDDELAYACSTASLGTLPSTSLNIDRGATGSATLDVHYYVVSPASGAAAPTLERVERHYPRGVGRGVLRGAA